MADPSSYRALAEQSLGQAASTLNAARPAEGTQVALVRYTHAHALSTMALAQAVLALADQLAAKER